MRRVLLASILTISAWCAAWAAPRVQLTIRDGRVWLVAVDATAAEIFAEWSRVGHTTVVNAARLADGRLTLQLTGVSEREALDVLLRAAAGFIAVPRVTAHADSSGAQSEFERILILPASRAPASAAGAPSAPAPAEAPPPTTTPTTTIFVAPGVQRIIGPDGLPVPDDQDDAPAAPPRPRGRGGSRP